MPTATLDKCTVCPETSKKHSLESIGHFHSWAYKLGKLKISKTQAPQSLGLLCNGLRHSTPWAFKIQKKRFNPKGIGKQSLFVRENKPASVPTSDTPAFKNDLYPGLLGLVLMFSPAGVFVV